MLVRLMKNNDRQSFLDMCRAFYSTGATTRGYDEKIADKTFDYLMSNHENLWGYIFEDKDDLAPVGYALITSYWCNEDGGNVILLDELYVSADQRKKGYGKMFMDWVENEFRDKAVAITLEVVTSNIIAKQLYNKSGFCEDGFSIMTKYLNKK